MKNGSTGKIIVLSAPSGAGKTTLLCHVLAQLPGLVYSISATTRAPRPGEIHGVHYYFVSRDEFRRRADIGEFAEWEEVHGNFYGTPKGFIDQVLGWGRHIVMDIDVKGKRQFDRVYPHAAGILILPPSLEDLAARLRARGSDSEESVALRLANARREIDFARNQGKYEHTLINDNLQQAKQDIVRLVLSILSESP